VEGLYLNIVADPSITLGAKVKMAARAVGVSEGDILDMIARAEKNAWVKQGKDITPEQAGEAVLARLRKVYAVNQEMPADIDQLVSLPNDQVKFGEDGNQDELQNFGGRR
jgi:glycerol-3-phosphate cytidylyltransferase-like family protein